MSYKPFTLKAAKELAAPHTWVASVGPCLIGCALAVCFMMPYILQLPEKALWMLGHAPALLDERAVLCFFLMLACGVLMQSAINTLNDYQDFKSGLDTAETILDETDASLIYNQINPQSALRFALVLLALAAVCGGIVVWLSSLMLLVWGLIAAAAVVLYSFGPKPISSLPLGEVVSGVVMGGILTPATFYAMTLNFTPFILAVALIPVIAIAQIMQTNNTCDIERDIAVGRKTLPSIIGEQRSRVLNAALACIAIQSNQNDQHGGQSIPNFDYYMGKGVAKTYRKFYVKNLEKALEFAGMEEGISDSAAVARDLVEMMEAEHGLVPTLADDNGFADAVAPMLDALDLGADAAQLTAFARKFAKKEVERATYQAMEALVHNLNTMHSRAGAQIPFSSLNYGTDISPEGRLVTKSVLLATEAGLGNGETPIFPIHIFKVKEGINYRIDDPNYDLFRLACRVSAKRLFPNFSFLDAPYNAQYYREGDPESEVAYMGCRTRVIANANDRGREVTSGRGNLSFSSVNLPRIAINAHGNIDIFFDELERKLDLVCDQLYDRYRIVAEKKVRNFPFLMGQGIWLDSETLGPDDAVGEVLRHGTLTVGFIGLAEALVALLGHHHGQNQEAQNLGLDIVGFMRARLDKRTRETGFNYTLIATPAEGLSGRFVRLDREKFGNIAGVTDRDYYTNSFHIPVHFNINAFDKIRLEAPYHALTNGGHITYVELDGDPCKNLEAFESIVRFMKESGVGYGSINHPIDRDPACGFNGIIDNECPRCHRTEEDGGPKFERIRRITGYLVGTLDRFNNAKRAEERDRVKHGMSCPQILEAPAREDTKIPQPVGVGR